MINTDYIIIGCGLAGIALCEKLRAEGKSFIVYDNNSQQSSIVAAGLYNPVILKRFSQVWKAKEQLRLALPMYSKIEKDLGIKIDYPLRILRRFTSIEEQNLWFSALDKTKLQDFLSIRLIKNNHDLIDAPFGFGEVLQAGRVDTSYLISKYKAFLKEQTLLIEEKFQYDKITFDVEALRYGNIKSKYIVCSEGFGVKHNPYFNHLPLNGTKGEVLTLRIPDLKIDYAIKSSVFVIPIGTDLYKVGSTYSHNDKTNQPTDEGRSELLTKLNRFLKTNYEIVEHLAGVRPTVKDRRPLVGRHPEQPNLFVLNGLGSRGVMVAPYVAENLFNHIAYGQELDSEIDIKRFV
jgi:glycine/D-amino acid oxidase-like deaminating enzyme